MKKLDYAYGKIFNFISEITSRWNRVRFGGVIDIGIKGNCGFDLGTEPSIIESLLDIFEGWKCDVAISVVVCS